ncbi:ribonuclease H-like domain-containing protein [Tanacetum coccineum]
MKFPRFTQKFEETFSEAWERFKELLRACPHHGFTELTQVDTFYNGLNENEQDSLNAAAGGNLLNYLEYIDNEVWNVIQNGNSKKRISTGKDGIVRVLSPVTVVEIQVAKKERKSKNILLMAIPKEHMRRFHGMDDAKEIWEAIRTRRVRKREYDRFQQLLSQLEAHGAEVSTEDANQYFLISLPQQWSNLAIDNENQILRLTIYLLMICIYLEFLSKEIQVLASFYSSNQFPEKEVLAGLNGTSIGKIAMIATSNEKFYKKTGGEFAWMENTCWFMTKRSSECFNCHNTGHFARECTAKGTHDGKKKRDSLYQQQETGKQEKNQMGLLTMDDGIVNWGEHTEAEEINHALMAISSSNEAHEIYEKDEKLKRYRRIGMKAVKEKEQLQKTVDSWKDSSKNLWKLIDSGMSSNSKVGLGFEIKSNNEVLSFEEEMNFSVFKCSKEDSIGKPSYSRFTKTNDFKGVPHPLSGDYTPKPQEEIDDSLYVYGKKGPQKPEISVSDDNSSEHSTCQIQMISEGSCGNTSEHSFETESESLSEPNEMSKSRLEVTNEKDVSAPKSKEVAPSCVSHIKTPRQPLKDNETHKVNRKN